MVPNQPKKEYMAPFEKKPDYSKDVELKNFIKDESLKVTKEYLQTNAFTERKVTDTPTDALSTVNRKFVTLNGTTAQRPTTSIIGQFYFDNTLGRPIWWDGTSFVDADGNVI